MITTIGIKAGDMGIDLSGTSLDVTKHMLSDPRRIGKIQVALNFPVGLQLTDSDKTLLQRVGDNCPVIKCLHPDLIIDAVYHWG